MSHAACHDPKSASLSTMFPTVFRAFRGPTQVLGIEAS